MSILELQELCYFPIATHVGTRYVPDTDLANVPKHLREEITYVQTYMELGRLSLFKAISPKWPYPNLALHLIRHSNQQPNRALLNRAALSGNADLVNALSQAYPNLRPN